MRHTPTPWRISQDQNLIKGANGFDVCQFGNILSNFTSRKANAERIVECVNAMQGISDPKEFRKRERLLWTERNQLRIQCDELRQENADLITLLMKANLFIESLNPTDKTIMEEIDEVVSKYNP